jgi:hypothetical protein
MNSNKGTNRIIPICIIRAAITPLPGPNLNTKGNMIDWMTSKKEIILAIPRELRIMRKAGSDRLKIYADERHDKITRPKPDKVIIIEDKYLAKIIVDRFKGKLAYVISVPNDVSIAIKIKEAPIHIVTIINVNMPMMIPPKSSIIAAIAIDVIKGMMMATPKRNIAPAIKSFLTRLNIAIPQITEVHNIFQRCFFNYNT